MLRILFVQTPTSYLGAGECVYPLGLSRLSGCAGKGFLKYSLDMNLHADPWPELKDILIKISPHIIALSFRNIDPLAGHERSYLPSLMTTARIVRHYCQNSRIIAGGTAFSLFSERLMNMIPEIDFGMVGESDMVFNELLSENVQAAAIPGLVWRQGEKIVSNHLHGGFSLDSLPSMDFELFSPEKYAGKNKYVAAMGIEGKRGCDLACSYCTYPFLGGKSMRLRSARKIVDEMESLYKDHGVVLFHFTDSMVNKPEGHFESVLDEILRRRIDIQWTGFFREQGLTLPLLDKARRAGLVAIYFSGDALYEKGLRVLNKNMTKEDIISASRISAESGILTMCHFLVNLPFETDKDMDESMEFLDEILDIHSRKGNLGGIIFNNVRLYPDAPLTRTLLKNRLLDPGVDLLYPVYYNPPESAHRLHELESICHCAGVFSRLEPGKVRKDP